MSGTPRTSIRRPGLHRVPRTPLDVWLAHEVLCNGPLSLLDSMQFLESPVIGLVEVDHRPEKIT